MNRNYYTAEEMEKARHADLGEFLLETDPDHYIVQYGCVRLIDPDVYPHYKGIKPISIKLGESWFHDFSDDGYSGSAIDYLVNYMDYDLVDAVKALAGSGDVEYKEAVIKPKEIKLSEEIPKPAFPPATDKKPRQMYAYLRKKRGIPYETIGYLEKAGLIYQDKMHHNVVFVNRDRDFAELRGTYSDSKPFHGIIKNQPDRYWDFIVGKPEKAYVCESAIDAISLYLLLKDEGKEKNAKYVSLGGVANQQTIYRIKRESTVILAVDNDMAGQRCRDRNSDCEAIVPIRKDWNLDLLEKLK